MAHLGAGFRGAIGGSAIVLAVAAAVAAVLAHGGRFDWRLDVLTHFAPFYLIAGALGLAAALAAASGRAPALGASVVAIVAGGLLMAPEFLRDAGPHAGSGAVAELRVIQFNAGRRTADVQRAADWLDRQNADIITLTEAPEALSEHLVRRGWKTAGAHGRLIIFTRKRYERMIRPALGPGGRLNFVNATYDLDAGQVEALTAHLEWPTRPVVEQQRRDLARVVASRPSAGMILTGDLNATPWSFGLRRMENDLGVTRRDRALATWPAQVLGRPWPLPFLPIDHIYAGRDWATVSVERGPWLGSDHYPVVVTLAPFAPR